MHLSEHPLLILFYRCRFHFVVTRIVLISWRSLVRGPIVFTHIDSCEIIQTAKSEILILYRNLQWIQSEPDERVFWGDISIYLAISNTESEYPTGLRVSVPEQFHPFGPSVVLKWKKETIPYSDNVMFTTNLKQNTHLYMPVWWWIMHLSQSFLTVLDKTILVSSTG